MNQASPGAQEVPNMMIPGSPEYKKAVQTPYVKLPNRADMKGELYEVKLATLYFLRGLNKGSEFCLATNLMGAGSYDDIVFRLWNNVNGQIESVTYFLQLKHRRNKKLPYNKAMEDVDKYCTLTCPAIDREMSASNGHAIFANNVIDNCEFILFTNAEKGGGWRNVLMDQPQSILDTGGEMVTVNPKSNDPKEKVFLSKCKVYIKQKNEKELERIIEEETMIACKCDKSEANQLVPIVLDIMKKWWDESNIYLTPDYRECILGEANKKMKEITITKLSQIARQKIIDLDITFLETHLHTIEAVIPSNGMLHIACEAGTAVISSIKILQVLKRHNFIFLKELTDLMTMIDIWGEGPWHTLVAVQEEITPETIKKLIDILKKNEDRCVVIISSNLPPIQHVYSVFEDKSTLKQLDKKSQTVMLERRAKFQGYEVDLKDLINSEEIKEAIDEMALSTLINRNDFLEIGQKLVQDLSFYEPQLLDHKIYINSKAVLNETEFPTTLAISGKDKQNLCTVGHSRGQCKLILLNDPDPALQYQELCERYRDIHWLEVVGDSLVWKQSKGDITTLLPFIDSDKNATYDTENILELPGRLMLIIAVPGMGKSTLFTHLAGKFKEIDHSSWVIHVDLSKYNELLGTVQSGRSDYDDMILSMLSKSVNSQRATFAYERALLKYSLEKKGNIKILLDEFDKVDSSYSYVGQVLIRKLREMKVNKLLVASRPIMKIVLEQELSLISCSLRHFERKQQFNIIVKLWKQKYPDTDPALLSKFGTDLLDCANKKTPNDCTKQFTGIPHHIPMLAEAYEDKLKTYICSSGVIGLPVNSDLNLLQLFEKFVEGRCSSYCNTHQNSEEDVDDYMDVHKRCSLSLLFSDNDVKELLSSDVQEKVVTFLNIAERNKEDTGIIFKVQNGKPYFIHDIFVEYFAAAWFAENHVTNRNFLKRILFNPTYGVLRDIFDRILSKDSKLHIAVLNNDIESVRKFLMRDQSKVNSQDRGGRTALHLAASYGKMPSDSEYTPFSDAKNNTDNSTYLLVEFLLSQKWIDISAIDHVFCWKPIGYAEYACAWSVVELLLQNNATTDFCHIKQMLYDKSYINPLLSIICKESLVKLMTFALNNGIKIDEFITCHIYISSDSTECTPLHIAARHGKLEFVKFLVRKGANPTLEDQYGQTPLHLACEFGKLDIVRYFVERGSIFRYWWAGQLSFRSVLRASISDVTNRSGESLLHSAILGDNLNVICYLVENKANITACNKDGETALFHANFGGECKTIHYLVEVGASVKVRNNAGFTPLHMAARVSEVHMIDFLITAGACINACTENDETPLHEAIWEGRTCTLDVVSVLVDNGADFSKSDVNRNTPLHKASKLGILSVVKYLLHKGAATLVPNKDGNIPLYLAAEQGKLEVVKCLAEKVAQHHINVSLLKAARAGKMEVIHFLLENNADINFCGEHGVTPLHEASEHGKLDTVKYLCTHCLNINACDNCGNTALHKAAKQGKFEVVKYLVNKNADFKRTNKNGDTALHKALDKIPLFFIESRTWNGSIVKKSCTEDGTTSAQLWEQKLQIVRYLASVMEDLNVYNKYGESPLHIAARHANQNVVEHLVQKGVLCNAISKNGRTPLDEAILSQASNIIHYLRGIHAKSCMHSCEKSYKYEFTHYFRKQLIYYRHSILWNTFLDMIQQFYFEMHFNLI